jgi:hypothetical protein
MGEVEIAELGCTDSEKLGIDDPLNRPNETDQCPGAAKMDTK